MSVIEETKTMGMFGGNRIRGGFSSYVVSGSDKNRGVDPTSPAVVAAVELLENSLR